MRPIAIENSMQAAPHSFCERFESRREALRKGQE